MGFWGSDGLLHVRICGTGFRGTFCDRLERRLIWPVEVRLQLHVLSTSAGLRAALNDLLTKLAGLVRPSFATSADS